MQVTINGTTQSINNLTSQQLSNLTIKSEIPIGVVNGINATFTSINHFIPESVELYINGLKQIPTDEFITIGSNRIDLLVSPNIPDTLLINYIKK